MGEGAFYECLVEVYMYYTELKRESLELFFQLGDLGFISPYVCKLEHSIHVYRRPGALRIWFSLGVFCGIII